jgi:hypothetical protein
VKVSGLLLDDPIGAARRSVDRVQLFEQIRKGIWFVDHEQTPKTRADHIEIALSQKGYRDDPIFHHTNAPLLLPHNG